MSEKIRVLCLTYEYDNILMWSYYSQSHKGYCFEFSHQNLINKIKKLGISGLCIYEEINYSSTRLLLKNKVSTFSYTDLKYYIVVISTKYLVWKYEKEYSFIIISKNFKQDFRKIKSNIQKIYEGCLGDSSDIYDNKGKRLKTIKLSKDDVEL